MITDGLLFNLSMSGDTPALTRLAKSGIGIYQIPSELQNIGSPFLNLLSANFGSIRWNISVIFRNYNLLKTCSMFLGVRVASKSLPRKLYGKAKDIEARYREYIATQEGQRIEVASLMIFFYIDTLKDLYSKVSEVKSPEEKKKLIDSLDKQACYITLFYAYGNLAGLQLYLAVLEAGGLLRPIDEFAYYRQQLRVFGKFPQLGLQISLPVSPKKSIISNLLSGVTQDWLLPFHGESNSASSDIRRVQVSASSHPEIQVKPEQFQALLGKTVRLFDL